MSEKNKQLQLKPKEHENIEIPQIPNVAYPLKPKNNTNVSQQYFNCLAGDESARFLFNNSGLWHQGIHLRASKFPGSDFENDKICAIADGKLIAYKVDSEYKKDSEVEVPMKSAVYSTGFFLLKHEMAYPKDNVLTFYSLYRHTAKLTDYPPPKRYITKSADASPVALKDRRGVVIAQLADGLVISIKSRERKAYRHELESYQDEQGVIHRPPNGDIWTIYKGSYYQEEEKGKHAIPVLSQHNIETQADKEVLLSGAQQIVVKAGEVLGLMGEYNQMRESGEKLFQLEVFTYDNMEQFKSRAEAAYKRDKEKKGLTDNFLYVARGSWLYTILNGEAVELEKTKVEIMVPLSDVTKQTVKEKQNPQETKTYYNVQPYLYRQVGKSTRGGIYVDDSHVTHGILFPGVNVFKDETHEVSIFQHKIAEYLNPESELSIKDKESLKPVFKAILEELIWVIQKREMAQDLKEEV
ncbi:glycoside hydrolase family 19 [Aggregatibacter actinomycetemcomitans]|uniref:glycoside hydrolase family 19 n=10 Tax=Aggregatibacter actinomycetemcomitans TaxID=714 RepID=UPI002150D406|nr:glycoside hydrolase family 19 [Aggregatibacter actinomycetemcomitans]